MSQQKFDNAFRDALWDTYGRKCFHCGRELLLRDMEIDHIVPEFLADDPRARAEVLNRIGLDPDFNIRGLENLVPSCSRCNSEKSGLMLADGAIAIALAKIKSKLPALEEALQNQRATRSIEYIMRTIDRAITAGKVTGEALLSELRRNVHFSGMVLEWRSVTDSSAQPPNALERLHPSIVWSARAMADLKRLGTNATEIFIRLQLGIMGGGIQAKKVLDGQHTYQIDLRDRERLLFRVKPDAVEVISIYTKRHATDVELKRLLRRGG